MKTFAGILLWMGVVVAGMSLAACATWKPVVLPSGQPGYTVDCSGTNLSWSHCYQKAGRACPHGYDVTQRTDSHGGKAEPGDLFGVLGASVQDRSLLIECRNDGVRRQNAPAASTGATTYPLRGGG